MLAEHSVISVWLTQVFAAGSSSGPITTAVQLRLLRMLLVNANDENPPPGLLEEVLRLSGKQI